MRYLYLIFIFMLSLSAQVFQAEDVLPADTILYFSVTDLGKVQQNIQNLSFAHIFQTKEWQVFWKSFDPELLKKFTMQKKNLEDQFGWEVKELASYFQGHFSLALLDLSLSGRVPMPIFLLTWNSILGKEKVLPFFEKLRQRAYSFAPFPIQETKETFEEQEITTINLPVPVHFIYHQNSILLSNNKEYLQNIILGNKVKEPKPILKSDFSYLAVKNKVLENQDGVFLYVNLQRIINILAQLGGPKIEEGLKYFSFFGLDTIQSLGASFTIRNKQVVESIYLYTPDGRKNLLNSILFPDSSSKNLLEYLPTRLFGISHGSFDIKSLYLGIKKFMQEAASAEQKQMFEKGMQDFFNALGLTEEDITGFLGSEYLFTMSKSDGWIPDILWQMHLPNPSLTENVLDKLLCMIPKKYIYDFTYNGQKFTYINFSTKREPIPVSPCFTIVGNRLLISLYPQTLKNLYNKPSEKVSGSPLADLLNGSYTMLEYVDLKSLLIPLYETAVPLLQASLPREKLPFEPALLPSIEFFSSYIGPAYFIAQHNAQGILWQIQTPAGTFSFLPTLTNVVSSIIPE